MKKILYSPGYGAGWSTWNGEPVAHFMATYEPIIDFIEAGNTFREDEVGGYRNTEIHPLLQQLIDECREKFNVDYVCVLGARDLQVETVEDNTAIKIDEYDGYESLMYREDQTWY